MSFFSKYFCAVAFVFCFGHQARGMQQIQQGREAKKLSGVLINLARIGIKKEPQYLEFISRIKTLSQELLMQDALIEQDAKINELCVHLNYFLFYARMFWVKPCVSSLVGESLGDGKVSFMDFVNSKLTAQEFLAENCDEKCKKLAQFFGDLEFSLTPQPE